MSITLDKVKTYDPQGLLVEFLRAELAEVWFDRDLTSHTLLSTRKELVDIREYLARVNEENARLTHRLALYKEFVAFVDGELEAELYEPRPNSVEFQCDKARAVKRTVGGVVAKVDEVIGVFAVESAPAPDLLQEVLEAAKEAQNEAFGLTEDCRAACEDLRGIATRRGELAKRIRYQYDCLAEELMDLEPVVVETPAEIKNAPNPLPF